MSQPTEPLDRADWYRRCEENPMLKLVYSALRTVNSRPASNDDNEIAFEIITTEMIHHKVMTWMAEIFAEKLEAQRNRLRGE